MGMRGSWSVRQVSSPPYCVAAPVVPDIAMACRDDVERRSILGSLDDSPSPPLPLQRRSPRPGLVRQVILRFNLDDISLPPPSPQTPSFPFKLVAWLQFSHFHSPRLPRPLLPRCVVPSPVVPPPPGRGCPRRGCSCTPRGCQTQCTCSPPARGNQQVRKQWRVSSAAVPGLCGSPRQQGYSAEVRGRPLVLIYKRWTLLQRMCTRGCAERNTMPRAQSACSAGQSLPHPASPSSPQPPPLSNLGACVRDCVMFHVLVFAAAAQHPCTVSHNKEEAAAEAAGSATPGGGETRC